jgi:hypothetical protein
MYERILQGLQRVDIKWFLHRGILPARNELVHYLYRLKAPFCQLMPIQAQPELLTNIIRLSLVLEDRLMDLSHLLQPLDLLLPHPILILSRHRRLNNRVFLVVLISLRLIRYCQGWIDYLEILLILAKYLLNYWHLQLILLDSLLSQRLRFEAHYTLCLLKAWIVAVTHDGPRLLVLPPRNNGRRFCVLFGKVSCWWQQEFLVRIGLLKLETWCPVMLRLSRRFTWLAWRVRGSFLQLVCWRDRYNGLHILSRSWRSHKAILVDILVVLVALVLCTRSHLDHDVIYCLLKDAITLEAARNVHICFWLCSFVNVVRTWLREDADYRLKFFGRHQLDWGRPWWVISLKRVFHYIYIIANVAQG